MMFDSKPLAAATPRAGWGENHPQRLHRTTEHHPVSTRCAEIFDSAGTISHAEPATFRWETPAKNLIYAARKHSERKEIRGMKIFQWRKLPEPARNQLGNSLR
jgi:hypothetical protein